MSASIGQAVDRHVDNESRWEHEVNIPRSPRRREPRAYLETDRSVMVSTTAREWRNYRHEMIMRITSFRYEQRGSSDGCRPLNRAFGSRLGKRCT